LFKIVVLNYLSVALSDVLELHFTTNMHSKLVQNSGFKLPFSSIKDVLEPYYCRRIILFKCVVS